MFSRNFKRLALSVLVPVASLGVLSALSWATKAEIPGNLSNVALQQAAQIGGRPISKLRVVSSVESKYPLQGITVFDFKVLDTESGAIYGISLNRNGQELSAAQLRANEQAAFAAQYGKLDPALAQKLATAPADKPIRVMLWLKVPTTAATTSAVKPQRPAPNVGGTSRALQAQVNALFQQVDAQRNAAVQSVVAPVASRLRALGTNVTTDKYAPVVYASLKPSAIRQAAIGSEVDQVYEDKIAQPLLNVASPTIFADVVRSRRISGLGVQVAEIEVGGIAQTSNPYLYGITQDTTYGCLDPHTTGVAGIIRSTNSTNLGIAPDVSLWVGGSCTGVNSEVQDRSTAAAGWGARVLNLSLSSESNRTVDGFAKFYDDMVINRWRTVVVAAGNLGNLGNVNSPGVAYNVITVGSFDDRGTLSLLDDKISTFSSGISPSSTHSDRIKPEVAAPGDNITSTTNASPWIGNIGSGTSYAAPMVTGEAALLIQRNSSLASWPEALKAIIMTSAVHNIVGDARLSPLDGAGGIAADRADDIAQGVNGSWGGQSYSCSTPTTLDVTTISLTAGVRTRATIAWDNDPNYSYYQYQPSADLDLVVVSPSGGVVTSSTSYDNNYEIVDFIPTISGTYKLRANKIRCDASPQWLGWAWRQGN